MNTTKHQKRSPLVTAAWMGEPMPAKEVAELIASYMEAIGTVAAVILALFLQVVLIRLKRPRLYMTLSSSLGEEDVVIYQEQAQFNCWIRCKVWAAKGRRPARNAEVFVQRVIRPDSASNTRVAPGGTLQWTSAESVHVSIPSGTWRRVDLLRHGSMAT
jgi:hypothetical protein